VRKSRSEDGLVLRRQLRQVQNEEGKQQP